MLSRLNGKESAVEQLELSLPRGSKDEEVHLPTVVQQEVTKRMAALMAQVILEDQAAPPEPKGDEDE